MCVCVCVCECVCKSTFLWFPSCLAPEVLLTSTSASLSLTDKDGNTALHLACSNVSVHLGALFSILFIGCFHACAHSWGHVYCVYDQSSMDWSLLCLSCRVMTSQSSASRSHWLSLFTHWRTWGTSVQPIPDKSVSACMFSNMHWY